MEEALVHSGHSLAILGSKSALSPLYKLENDWFGLPQLRHLQTLHSDAEKDMEVSDGWGRVREEERGGDERRKKWVEIES